MTFQSGRYIDPKLSRGLVRQEARGLVKDLDEALDSYLMTVMPAQTHFAKTGKLPESLLREVHAKAKRLAAESPAFLSFEISANLASMIRSRQVVKTSTIHIAPARNDAFRVESMRVLMSRGSLVVAAMGSPLIFTRHLAERILQRRRHELDAKPVRAVGDALMGSIGLIALGARAAANLPERRLSIPYEDGLILGEVLREDGMPSAISIWDKDGESKVPPQSCMAIFPAGEDGPVDRTGTLVFRANTFIGPREMRPEQVALRDKLLDIAARHKRALDMLTSQTLFARTPGFGDFGGFDLQDGDLGRLLEAHSEIENLLKVAGWAKAMGNSAGMPATFYSMKDVFAERYAAMREEFGDDEIGWRPPGP